MYSCIVSLLENTGILSAKHGWGKITPTNLREGESMRLYNTLTSKIVTFKPAGRDVGIYVCGITPYDTTHIGHAFTYTSVDILIRYLRLLDLNVTYVQNVTDIDDDILRRAGEVGEDWRVLGNRWTSHFITDMKALNVIPPTDTLVRRM
jgi:L-cysteine:1D-myo-inositol 2-amino-2-deoxy-alpha-D-glucopyranoside ligase